MVQAQPFAGIMDVRVRVFQGTLHWRAEGGRRTNRYLIGDLDPLISD